jgi:hypothetical protein
MVYLLLCIYIVVDSCYDLLKFKKKEKNMERIFLTDESNHWFDITKATEFSEGTHFDGNNKISLAVGMYQHNILYRTASGKWVLHFWSETQSKKERYELISVEKAVEWFVKNEYEDEKVPESLKGLYQRYLTSKEL